MQTLCSFDIKQFWTAGVINLKEFKKLVEQVITTENLYLNLLNNNNVNGIQLFVFSDGDGTLKICAQTNYSEDSQLDILFKVDELEVVKAQLEKSQLKLESDYNNYVRQINDGQKPIFKPAFKQVMTCIKNLDNPYSLPLGSDAVTLSDYDHTIVARSQLFSEPPLVGQGIAELFQLSDLSFIINPDPIFNCHFDKVRVKASVETSFEIIRGRCYGRGVHGRYKLEKIGSNYQLIEFEFTEPELLSEQ
ncbi:hypothetical protein [Rheinheimera texasensis]|uniref:hypothetical protein n=1 Tax=Rheinheimera texasensis TaxID=306205 RepID=UPI0004E24470|nr:hypothetical protein [Rheinheimera texasensis]